jgi:hypothetical protein
VIPIAVDTNSRRLRWPGVLYACPDHLCFVGPCVDGRDA